MIGLVFGRWKVVSTAEPVGYDRKWKCRCNCGSVKDVFECHLVRGKSQSCGCLTREVSSMRMRTHGHSVRGAESPEYSSWCSMIWRTRKNGRKAQRWYSGKGISVCDRWRLFENFLADMGKRPAGKTLDRINNDGNYEPGNCRWADASEQALNRGKRIDNSTGYIGVSKGRSGKFLAAVCVGKVRRYVGSFNSAADAHKAYIEAKNTMMLRRGI